MNIKNLFNHKILIILLLPLVFNACENSTENKNPSPSGTSLFPNTVGDKWTYAIQDSLTHSIDTLSLRIIGNIPVNGKSYSVWVRKSNIYNDTFYVSVDHDTVKYYDDPTPNFI
ncbi:MAG TPA: hypothetical protein VLB50_07750, partial [Ignavibacteriaceae bacterium]|nr:hypothetical protein [Ignavibacteriaceae bacterium]